MPTSTQNLLTVGELARRLKVPLHRIEYLLRTREIEPSSWAGNARVYSERDLPYLTGELRRIDAEREVENE